MAGLKKLVGVYGGTFDPPHKGHLLLAQTAQDQLSLSQVLWVLTKRSPHKKNEVITPVEIRLELLNAALKNSPDFTISRIEIDRNPPYYALETLRLLQAEVPEASLVYLMGEDSLYDLPTWYRPCDFIEACSAIGVLRRAGYDVDLRALEQLLPGVTEKIRWIQVPKVNISASMIREKVRHHQPYGKYVSAAVAVLIEKYCLYHDKGPNVEEQA
jgi:nicotinate-nucleotide adenylyltransferase